MLGPTRALPDFLTPRPAVFAPDVDDELATVRATPPDVVRRDLVATHAPDDVPAALAAADTATLADLLRRYWEIAIAPMWQQIRLLLEADVT